MNSYIKLAVVFIVFFIFFGFLGIKISGLLAKPSIEIHQPKNLYLSKNLNLAGGDVIIKGKARRVNFLELNGRPVLLSKDGSFEENLIFASGLNMVELRAKDKHNKIYFKEIMLMVKN